MPTTPIDEERIARALAGAREKANPESIQVPWRVVRHGRRLVDLEAGAAPRLFRAYADEAFVQRAAVERAIEEMTPLLSAEQFWRTLLGVRALDPPVTDPRNAIHFTARDAFDLYMGLIVSGMPISHPETLLTKMEEVLRPVFPESDDVLGEDLCDPRKVPLEVLESLDGSTAVRGMATPYLTVTTFLFVRYSFNAVHKALCEAAALSSGVAGEP